MPRPFHEPMLTRTGASWGALTCPSPVMRKGNVLGSRRTMIVVVSVVLAALAAAMTFVYVRGIEARAFRGAELVQVFVVTKDIPRGLPGEQAAADSIKAAKVPRDLFPSSAVTSLDALAGKVAVAPLATNTILVAGQFVDPRQEQVTFSQKIPAGQVAITVSVDQVRGVAGLLVPGDKVNILVADGARNGCCSRTSTSSPSGRRRLLKPATPRP